MKFHLRKGDFVQVTKGKDKGKKGRILEVIPENSRVLVEGINFAVKHSKPTATDRQGGIQHREKPVSIANVSYFCMKCTKNVKLGSKVLQDGSKTRYCKKCNEIIEAK